MMTTDEVTLNTDSPSSHKGSKRKAYTHDMSQQWEPCSQGSNPKRARSKTTRSATTTALGVSVMSLENIQIHNKVDQLLNLMTGFKSTLDAVSERVKAVEETVGELKLNFITTAPPVNAETMLEGIKTDIQALKESLHPFPVAELSSTQEAVMTMGEPPAVTNPEITAPPVGDPAIKAKDVIPDYQKHISRRRHAYYKYLHNRDRLSIHKEWRDRETPFYPARFVPKKVTHGESEAEYQVRKNQKLKELDSYLEILQIRRDMGQATFDSVDLEIPKVVADLDLTADQRLQVIEEYALRVAAEEAKSQKMWAKGKQGVEGIVDRSASKFVSEDDRTYTVVSKKHKRTSNPRKRVNNKTTRTYSGGARTQGHQHAPDMHRYPGVTSQLHQQVTYPLVDLSVPPPFQGVNRTRSQRY